MPKTAARTRISRVRLKATGQEVRVISRPERDELSRTLVEHAGIIAAGKLAGFVVIGWLADGAYNISLRCPYESAIPLTLLPEWIAEIVRREGVTNKQIHDVIDHG